MSEFILYVHGINALEERSNVLCFILKKQKQPYHIVFSGDSPKI